jgi:ABC-type maltose transport system permease subunit
LRLERPPAETDEEKMYMLPVVILFLLIQKNIQKGMLFTGLHG